MAEVIVTQDDREAAARRLSLNEPTTADLIARGRRDNHPLVQAFARHRLAVIEECARVAEKLGRQHTAGADRTTIARNIATAIRQLSGDRP